MLYNPPGRHSYWLHQGAIRQLWSNAMWGSSTLNQHVTVSTALFKNTPEYLFGRKAAWMDRNAFAWQILLNPKKYSSVYLTLLRLNAWDIIVTVNTTNEQWSTLIISVKINVQIMQSNWLLLIRIWVSSKASSHIQLFPIGSQFNGDYTCTRARCFKESQTSTEINGSKEELPPKKEKSQSTSSRRTRKNSKEVILSATCFILLYSDWLWQHRLPTFPPTNRTEWTPQATVPSGDTKRLILKTWRKKIKKNRGGEAIWKPDLGMDTWSDAGQTKVFQQKEAVAVFHTKYSL